MFQTPTGIRATIQLDVTVFYDGPTGQANFQNVIVVRPLPCVGDLGS
jgi:hypothetical protein